MKLQTITTIETVNICNLKCKYCVSRKLVEHPARKPGVMDQETFDQSLEILKHLCGAGTQNEVNMNGNGEPLLDPDIVSRVKRVKEIVGDRPVMFSTNGLLMTEELAKKLKDTGISKIDVSPHSAYHARICADIFRRVGISGVLNCGAITSPHNFAGQIDSEHSVEIVPEMQKMKCDPLYEGRGYILKEGNITPCCYDYQNLGVFGTIWDIDIFDREIFPYKLCATCHQNN